MTLSLISTVDLEECAAISSNFLDHCLQDGLLQGMGVPFEEKLFQMDGAQLRIGDEILDLLHVHFGHRIISNCVPQHLGYEWTWQPCFPDLNHCDHFLWQYLKDNCTETILMEFMR